MGRIEIERGVVVISYIQVPHRLRWPCYDPANDNAWSMLTAYNSKARVKVPLTCHIRLVQMSTELQIEQITAWFAASLSAAGRCDLSTVTTVQVAQTGIERPLDKEDGTVTRPRQHK